nr:MAG TPA: hypothetical protein [Crassvirales sp.]
MIKYSGIYESSTPPTSTKALWVDGGVLKIYKNGSWRPVDDPKSKLTIDSILKAGSTNPVENRAIHSRFIGVDKSIEVNKNNIGVLTGRVNEVDGIAKGAEALAKVNEKRINSVEALANANEAKSQDNASKIYTLSHNLADVKNTADGNKHDIESLTNRTIKPIESKVSQLQELNVVYPNNIRNLTTESTVAEVKEAFIPAIGGTADRVNTPHVGYLIKGAAYEDSSEDNPEYGPDSTIISVDIIKTDNKDYHKFIYVDNNTAIISVTVDLVNYRLIDKSTLANIEATSKVGTLRDLYISAGAVYNEATGYYELNGLTDITEEQMGVIYEKTWGWWIGLPNSNGFGDSSARTNIPCPDYKRAYYQSNINLSSSFATTGNLDNLEVLNFIPTQYPKTLSTKLSMRSMNWMCQGNAKPLTIMGTFDVGDVPDNNNLNIGGNIKTINIKNLSKNIRFYGSKVLSKESVLYMIQNSAATSAITISLNKAVYDVMKDDADIIAALAEKTNITLIQDT